MSVVWVWSADTEDFTASLPDMIALMSEIQETHSVEGDLRFRMKMDHRHYDDPATFSVWIERDETPAEIEARQKDDRERNLAAKQERESRELAQYQVLKAKFERTRA